MLEITNKEFANFRKFVKRQEKIKRKVSKVGFDKSIEDAHMIQDNVIDINIRSVEKGEVKWDENIR